MSKLAVHYKFPEESFIEVGQAAFVFDARWPFDVTWVDYKEHIEWTTVCDSKTFAIALQEFIDRGEDFAVSFDHDLQEYHLKSLWKMP